MTEQLIKVEPDWKEYERRKREIRENTLSYEEYEEQVRQMIKEMGI